MTYIQITDEEIAANQPVTRSLITRLRDNILAAIGIDGSATSLPGTLGTNRVSFTANGTFTVLKTGWYKVVQVGGGGGGSGSSTNNTGGGGGGAGAVVTSYVYLTVGTVLTITIGAGGIGSSGAAFNGMTAPGGTGGTTSIAGLPYSALGGLGGTGNNNTTPAVRGANGSYSGTGTVAFSMLYDIFASMGLNTGSNTVESRGAAGYGANGDNNQGATDGIDQGFGKGTAGKGFGAGGGGGGRAAGTGGNGGNGAPGFVSFEWVV